METVAITAPDLDVRFRERRTRGQRQRHVARTASIARQRTMTFLARTLGPVKRRLFG